MKLVLKNFKHHRDVTFTFPSSGMIIITGNNGTGKTTIMKAISHAFFGNIKKPCSWNTTSYCIELELKDIKIIRKKSGLVVEYENNTYEGEAAQGVINGYLGMNEKVFEMVCLSNQRTSLKIITLTPEPQAQFIETITFRDNVCKQTIRDAKENTKLRKEEHQKMQTEFTVLEKEFEKAKLEINNIVITNAVTRNISEVENDITINKEKIKEVTNSISLLEKEYEREKEQKMRMAELDRKIIRIEEDILHLNNKRDELGSLPSSDDVLALEKKVLVTKTSLADAKTYFSANVLEQEVRKEKSDYIASLQKELSIISMSIPENPEIFDALIKEQDKLNLAMVQYEENLKIMHDYEINIAKYKENLLNAITFVKKEFGPMVLGKNANIESIVAVLSKREVLLVDKITKLEKEIQELSQKQATSKIYTCVTCTTKFNIINDEVVMAQEQVKKAGKQVDLGKRLKEVNIKLDKERQLLTEVAKFLEIMKTLSEPKEPLIISSDIKAIPDKLNELNKTLMIIENAKNQRDKIRKKLEVLPDYIQKKEKMYKSLYQKLPKMYHPPRSVEDVEKELEKISSEFSKICKQKSDHALLNREIAGKEKILSELQKKKPVTFLKIESNDVTNEVKKLQDIKDNLNNKIVELYEEIELARSFKTYKEKKESFEILSKEFEEANAKTKLVTRRLEGAIGVEEVLKEAKIKAMENTIQSINSHAKKYLDMFFTEPIDVRLCGEKDRGKKGSKIQMNVYVAYNGEIHDSIDDLSDGQIQKCELAFFLGMNDMFNGKFVFLDEAMGKVDSNMGPLILQKLKAIADQTPEKLFVFVSQETIKGVFDEKVCL